MSSFLLFVFGGQKDVVQMPVSLRCVQYMVTSVLCGVKSSLMVEKVLLMRKNLVTVLSRRPMQRSQQSIVSYSLTPCYWIND